MTKLVSTSKELAASSSFRQLGKLFWGQWPKLFPGRLHGRRTAGHSRSHPPFQRESNIFSVSGKEHALGPGGSKDNSPSLSSFLAREWCSPVLPQKIQDLQVHVAAKVLECGTMMKFSVWENSTNKPRQIRRVLFCCVQTTAIRRIGYLAQLPLGCFCCWIRFDGSNYCLSTSAL
jgi:hypothetical protein